MQVWLVRHDTHDYDYVQEWTVGIFMTPEKAKEASDLDLKRFRKKDRPSVNIEEIEIDKVYKN